MQIVCISTMIFADLREGAEMKLLSVVPGAMDWATNSVTVGLGFEATAATTSLRQGSSKQVSCGASMDFLSILIALVNSFSHTPSAAGDKYYVYALVAEYDFESGGIAATFAAQELPNGFFE